MLRSKKDTERKEQKMKVLLIVSNEMYRKVYPVLKGLGIEFHQAHHPDEVALDIVLMDLDTVIVDDPLNTEDSSHFLDFMSKVSSAMHVVMLSTTCDVLSMDRFLSAKVVDRRLANLPARLIAALMEIDPELPEWVKPVEHPLPDWLLAEAERLHVDWPDP